MTKKAHWTGSIVVSNTDLPSAEEFEMQFNGPPMTIWVAAYHDYSSHIILGIFDNYDDALATKKFRHTWLQKKIRITRHRLNEPDGSHRYYDKQG